MASVMFKTENSAGGGDSRWILLAPFLKSSTTANHWLEHLLPPRHHVVPILRDQESPNWHLKRKPITSAREWWSYFILALRGLRQRRGGGVITVFPQLASLVGLLKRLTFGRYPVIAYFYNTVEYRGLRRALARFSARGIDRFVVHTTAEIVVYARWLGLPTERFVFIPLQAPNLAAMHPAGPKQERLVFATGSGQRDYATLFAAVDGLNCRVVIAPGLHAIAGLEPPPNVELRFDITRKEILRLSQEATINVIPMNTGGPTAGIVTIVDVLRMGGALVVTDRPGIGDYVEHESNSLLVPAGDVVALRAAIDRLLTDDKLRCRLGRSAAERAAQDLSDETAARRLVEILDSFCVVDTPAGDLKANHSLTISRSGPQQA